MKESFVMQINYLFRPNFHLLRRKLFVWHGKKAALHFRSDTILLQYRVQYTVWYDTIVCITGFAEPVFVNVYGAQESIPRNRFRQPM